MKERFRLPLIPVLFFYTAGLYIGHYELPLTSQGMLVLLAVPLVFWILSLATKKIQWGSWFSLLFFFALGIFSIHTYLRPQFPSSHISRFVRPDQVSLEGVIDRPPHSSDGITQLFIRAEKVILSNHPVPVSGSLLLFSKDGNGPFHLGDRLRLMCKLSPPGGFHNPGGFNYERYLAFQGIHTLGFLSEDQGWVKIGKGPKIPILLWIEGWRDHIRDFLGRETDAPSSAILKALVLGEQGSIPEEVKEAFTVTGISHLLAISGDHLGIVALLSFSLLTWLLKRSELLLLSLSVKKWAAVLTLPCILLYTFIAGAGISVVRATIMVIVFFLSILFDRERNLLHTLALAAFLILIFSPPSLFDVSFQLSFLAVLSILYLVPRVLQAFRREELPVPLKTSWKQALGQYTKISLLVTTVATLGTAPFVALHFNRISPIGLVSNLFFIPWVGFVVVPVALLASLLSFLFYPLAAFLIHVDGLLTSILLEVVGFFASIPLASLFVSTPTSLEIVLFYFLLFLVPHVRKKRKAKYVFLGVCVVLALDLAIWNLRDHFQKNLRVTFIDVGQGDSILVEFPKGKKMLIDGGGLYEDRFDIGKRVLAPLLWKKRIRRIDYLVLTHPDPDHLKGLNFIVSHFSIGEFWETGFRALSDSYAQLEQTLCLKGIQRFPVNGNSPSQRINGVQISIFNPRPSHTSTDGSRRESRNPSAANNQSLVMMLQFGKIAILLPGDIEEEAEYWILRGGYPLRANVLKVPHHGSRSSSSPFFLDRVKPDYAILTVGQRNIGRLPHPEVLRRYQQIGSRIFRTDKHGAVTVITDGEKMTVTPFLNVKDQD